MATFKTWLHVYHKGLNQYTKKPVIDALCLEQSFTAEEWKNNFKSFGTLLAVEAIEIEIPSLDPVKVEVDKLKEEVTAIQAKAEQEIKQRRDRINDLLMIGYDTGSVTVITDVEVKPATPGEDDGIPF